MRRWTVVAVAAALAVGAVPAVFADSHEGDDDATMKWFGSLRIRPEYNDNLSDVALSRDDAISYFAYRANLGFKADLDMGVTLLFDGQALGLWGEDQSPFRGGQSGDATSAKFNFYRAYIQANEIFGHPFSLTAGRQPLVFGDEWLLGDLDFYGGTSWDSLRGDFTHEAGNVSVFYAKVAETNSPEANALTPLVSTPDTSGDFDLYGVWTKWDLTENQTLDAALLYGLDHRDFDLDPATVDTAFRDKRFTWTARYNYSADEGPWVNVNAAFQNGTTANSSGTDTLDIKSAWAAEGTAGWTWLREDRPSTVWIRLAHYTGDDAGTEDRNEAFSILAMDFHQRYGYLDFWTGFWGREPLLGGSSGFQSLQIGFDVEIPNGVRVKGMAQRARRDSEFSESANIRNLGQEYGLAAIYDYGKNLSLELGVAQLFPGSAFKAEPPLFGQSSVRRAYLNTVVRF